MVICICTVVFILEVLTYCIIGSVRYSYVGLPKQFCYGSCLLACICKCCSFLFLLLLLYCVSYFCLWSVFVYIYLVGIHSLSKM
jgi:hypothetical protein